MSLLSIFTTRRRSAASSDSFCSNPRYDELFDAPAEGDRRDRAARPTSTRCSSIFYDEAPYHILYYDAELHAYRTDKFAGWQNQPPESGTPLFAYGSIDYTLLTDADGGVAGAVGRRTGARRAERAGAAAPAPAPTASGTGDEHQRQRQHAAADRRGRRWSSSWSSRPSC